MGLLGGLSATTSTLASTVRTTTQAVATTVVNPVVTNTVATVQAVTTGLLDTLGLGGSSTPPAPTAPAPTTSAPAPTPAATTPTPAAPAPASAATTPIPATPAPTPIVTAPVPAVLAPAAPQTPAAPDTAQTLQLLNVREATQRAAARVQERRAETKAVDEDMLIRQARAVKASIEFEMMVAKVIERVEAAPADEVAQDRTVENRQTSWYAQAGRNAFSEASSTYRANAA